MNEKTTMKVAIRIDRQYTPKNKLHKQILENIKPFNHTLWDYSTDFITEIHKAVDLAHAQCSTRCKSENLQSHSSPIGSSVTFYVSGLIYIEMMYLTQFNAA